MTLARLISPSLRSGLLIAAGTTLIMVPFPAGLSPAAAVTGIAIGALAVALGVAGTAHEGRGTLPLSAHSAYDRGLALGLLVVASIFGAGGDGAALLLFGAAGLATLAVTSVTRYSVRRV
jgi:hypothetical protein